MSGIGCKRNLGWYARNLIYGLIDSIIIILIYIYIFPMIISNIYSSIGYSMSVAPTSKLYIVVLFLVLALSLVARLMKGTVFEPVLKASANMFGVVYALSYIGSGLIEIKNIKAGDLLIDVSFDISPLLLVFFAFFVVPSVVEPFITYFFKEDKC